MIKIDTMTNFHLFLGLITLLLFSCENDKEHSRIYYEFPEPVIEKIEDQVLHRTDEVKGLNFALLFTEDSTNIYSVSIIEIESSNTDNFDLINKTLVQGSNRVVKVNQLEVPLIFSTDLIFADFGKKEMPDGRISRTRVIFNFDGFSFSFNRAGQIIQN